MAVTKLTNYETVPFILTGGKDSVVTVPTGFWYDLTRIRVSIGTGSAGTAKLIWYQARSTTEFILNDAGQVAVGVPLDEECDPLHMEVGDILKITASVANMHAFVSFIKGSTAPAETQGRPGAQGFKFGPGFGAT